MIFKRFIVQNRRRILYINIRQMRDYEGAIKALNCLQSNADYLRSRNYNNTSTADILEATIVQDKKYLERSGITWKQLDQLSVIHVTGTKGKGSTCAYCESILRHHGFRTGFYSSPHLVEVRERIRLNGEPIKKELFAQYFWDLYDTLKQNMTDAHDIPLYFRFLTIMAFKVFIEEKVDVAVIEVGIGGEYDCTNVLRKVPVVGITSLGLDHMNLLGNTIEAIAWNKAGIMKEGTKVFTVPQTESALKVLKERSVERKSELHVVSCDINGFLNYNNNNIPPVVLKPNVSLALALTQAWLSSCGSKINGIEKLSQTAVKNAILTCSWPGRYQIIATDLANFYLDGAHTMESINVCAQWFIQKTKTSSNKKVLIFNTTGNRDSTKLLLELYKCNFSTVVFVPNVAKRLIQAAHFWPNFSLYLMESGKLDKENNKNVVEGDNIQLKRCEEHGKIWKSIEANLEMKASTVKVLPTVLDAIEFVCQYSKCDILITGSLHLVGSALSVIQEKESQRASIASC